MGCALKHLHRNAIVSAFFYDREAAMIFETHAHYDDAAFDEDRDQLLSSMKDGFDRDNKDNSGTCCKI